MARHKARQQREPRKAPTRAEKVGRETPVGPLRPQTPRQADYLVALHSAAQVFGVGPAGTGKTYMAAAYAGDQLRDGGTKKVILTRPNEPAGRSLGFFPGDLGEKMAPWVIPLISTINQRMGASQVEMALKNGKIEIVPFETMRGRSFDNSIVIVDEAQNVAPKDMYMLLTRIGEWSKLVVTGDLRQQDIKGESGLAVALRHIYDGRISSAKVINFGPEDIVRGGICAEWVRAWDHE